MSDYYEILGVEKDASQEEIRRAYKLNALKYHPDKCSGDTDKFKHINEAYQILGDPEQRQIYDNLTKDSNGEFWRIMNIFLSAMKDYMKTQVKKQLIFDIKVNLVEIYRGDIKKLTITTKKRDGIFVQKNLYIPLKGIKSSYVFEGEGDETFDGSSQDIIVKIQVVDDVLIKRDNILNNQDLHIEIPISLYEYYMGFEKEIRHLDDELIKIAIPGKPLRNKTNISCFNKYVLIEVLTDKGLPDEDGKKGKLYVYFNLVLPDMISHDLLQKISEYDNGIA